MEDQAQGSNSHNNSTGGNSGEKAGPIRSRWMPKPEQILILELIFNSGMVNPPKSETVRIRKLLEKFGPVGDANVFYWFQNRRSRSRLRQRQMQAAAAASAAKQMSQAHAAGAIQFEMHHGCRGYFSSGTMATGETCSSYNYGSSNAQFDFHGGPSSSCRAHEGMTVDQLFPQIGFPSEPLNAHFQSGIITVFINGIPTEVPRGSIDKRTLFGEDAILVHSSGLPIPTDEFGSLIQSLEHGESYFLVDGSA